MSVRPTDVGKTSVDPIQRAEYRTVQQPGVARTVQIPSPRLTQVLTLFRISTFRYTIKPCWKKELWVWTFRCRKKTFAQSRGRDPFPPRLKLMRLGAARAGDGALDQVFSRVPPSDAGWPSEERWDTLSRHVEGRLIKVKSPLSICREAPDSPSCGDVFKPPRNPDHIGDQPGLNPDVRLGRWLDIPSQMLMRGGRPED